MFLNGEHLLGHHLLKLLVGDVHEAPGAQHLQQLAGHVPGDGLHQPQGSLDRVLRVTILPEMVEDSLNSHPVQLSGGQQVVDGEVLHQWVVVNGRGQSLLQPGVSVEGHGAVEPLAILEDVQG